MKTETRERTPKSIMMLLTYTKQNAMRGSRNGVGIIRHRPCYRPNEVLLQCVRDHDAGLLGMSAPIADALKAYYQCATATVTSTGAALLSFAGIGIELISDHYNDRDHDTLSEFLRWYAQSC